MYDTLESILALILQGLLTVQKLRSLRFLGSFSVKCRSLECEMQKREIELR
jgi:hypothetical protein